MNPFDAKNDALDARRARARAGLTAIVLEEVLQATWEEATDGAHEFKVPFGAAAVTSSVDEDGDPRWGWLVELCDGDHVDGGACDTLAEAKGAAGEALVELKVADLLEQLFGLEGEEE